MFKTNLLMSTVTSEMPLLLGNEGVVCVLRHMFSTNRQAKHLSWAPPFSPPERPVVMALKSVSNSWNDDTCTEKNGRTKVA